MFVELENSDFGHALSYTNRIDRSKIYRDKSRDLIFAKRRDILEYENTEIQKQPLKFFLKVILK